MRKDLGKQLNFVPLPVLIIATYDENNKANAMNAAWGGVSDNLQIYISLSQHKTTQNLLLKKAFSVSFATTQTAVISDYFGLVSGIDEDKISKANVTVTHSKYIDAPIIEEYPLTLECEMESFKDGILIGNIINVSVDEKYLDKDGNIDVDKMGIIAFDMISNTYRVLGKVVAKAFQDGLKIK